ncbi:hypothetical protein RO3G_12442 [Rhizopus delemar RA 99-880]|uniref:Uncharacterized protein n=1 Tax=Rhizopus delemar (strain RA 99-880 / ATCC MYA-4621 / FGSC 9543 / NRRL 43880) TaxID=246409 RepID=I1CH01_RHIO9|nr:hypothetical protein RO3G_12442 [Rhizopus delemar RA 99-880]|eukprot:EIE87731.1 hypothetical protein RO3G_12442 [Rhizopus delemar RA 99-880]
MNSLSTDPLPRKATNVTNVFKLSYSRKLRNRSKIKNSNHRLQPSSASFSEENGSGFVDSVEATVV